MPDEQEIKVRENRLRRMAARQGFALHKSRVRDVNALGHGTYMIVNPHIDAVVYHNWDLPGGFGLDLDDVEAWLLSPWEEQPHESFQILKTERRRNKARRGQA